MKDVAVYNPGLFILEKTAFHRSSAADERTSRIKEKDEASSGSLATTIVAIPEDQDPVLLAALDLHLDMTTTGINYHDNTPLTHLFKISRHGT